MQAYVAYEMGVAFSPPECGFKIQKPLKLWWVLRTQVPVQKCRAERAGVEYTGQVWIRLLSPRSEDAPEFRHLNDNELASAHRLLTPVLKRRNFTIHKIVGVSWSSRAGFVDIMVTFS